MAVGMAVGMMKGLTVGLVISAKVAEEKKDALQDTPNCSKRLGKSPIFRVTVRSSKQSEPLMEAFIRVHLRFRTSGEISISTNSGTAGTARSLFQPAALSSTGC